MATIQEEMRLLRTGKGMTMRDVAARCDMHHATICKAESTHVRWETIHAILVSGLRIRAGSPDYERAKEAWLKSRLRITRKRAPATTTIQTGGLTEKQMVALHDGIEKLIREIKGG
jgi:hypothetical protein